jgi:hypothetical protein
VADGSDRATRRHSRDHGLAIVIKDIIRLLNERRNEIDRLVADEDAGFLALA